MAHANLLPVDDADRLLADLAAWDAARARQDESWLRRQAEEEARFTGIVLDVAEQADAVTVLCTTGRRHRGRIALVADDFFVVHDNAALVLLPYAGVAALRPSPGAGPVAGSTRSPSLGMRLVHALAGLAADRPRVNVVVHGGESMRGELRSVGADVLTLQLDGGTLVHVRVDAVAEVTTAR